jgi:hypothetical protein
MSDVLPPRISNDQLARLFARHLWPLTRLPHEVGGRVSFVGGVDGTASSELLPHYVVPGKQEFMDAETVADIHSELPD